MIITVFIRFSYGKRKAYRKTCNSIRDCQKAVKEFKLNIKKYPELNETRFIGAVIWDGKWAPTNINLMEN